MKIIVTGGFVKDKVEIEGYKCISEIYINSKTKLDFICPEGHFFSMIWNCFQQGQRCPECYGNKKLTYEFVKKQFESEGYSLISKAYKNNHTRLVFICPQKHTGSMIYASFRRNRRCPRCHFEYLRNIKGINSPNYKGGVTKKNLPLFDTYANQLDWCEEVRRDPKHPNILNVRCTETSCRKWFIPTTAEVRSRINSINGEGKGELRFYCSSGCKQNCSIYRQVLYPRDHKSHNNRDSEVQSELRDIVLERDEYTCIKCGSINKLECHHIESINYNPLMSADIDNCMTICESCHDEIHREEGCRYVDLQKRNLC